MEFIGYLIGLLLPLWVAVFIGLILWFRHRYLFTRPWFTGVVVWLIFTAVVSVAFSTHHPTFIFLTVLGVVLALWRRFPKLERS